MSYSCSKIWLRVDHLGLFSWAPTSPFSLCFLLFLEIFFYWMIVLNISSTPILYFSSSWAPVRVCWIFFLTVCYFNHLFSDFFSAFFNISYSFPWVFYCFTVVYLITFSFRSIFLYVPLSSLFWSGNDLLSCELFDDFYVVFFLF